MRKERFSGALHMRGVGIGADELQRVIGFHARADIEVAAVEQGPAAMAALNAAQIDSELALNLDIDLVEEMLEQDVLGRNDSVRFQFEHPMPVRLLARFEIAPRFLDHIIEQGYRRRRSGDAALLEPTIHRGFY